MRPAQKAPENTHILLLDARAFLGFNEAGAKSAGKRVGDVLDWQANVMASMRPAQKAPENRNAA